MFDTNDTAASAETLLGLVHDSRGLPVPRDYFAGQGSGNVRIPRNILAFVRTRGMPSSQPEWHHRYVLIVNLETAGTLRLDTFDVRLEPGQALLIQPFQRHRYLAFDRATVHWLFITFEATKPNDYPEWCNRQHWLSDRDGRLVGAFLDEYRQALRLSHSPLPALRLALLLERMARTGVTAGLAVETTEFVAAVLRLASASLDRRLSAGAVAKELKMSVRTLRARFAREAGLSLGRAIRRERLLLARTLLLTTSDSISSIASRCGFTSIYSFSRAFSRLMGQAPTAIRQGGRSEG